MLTSDLIFSGDVMWQQTPAAERVYARKRVRSEFIERRRVWERVAARRGRGGFIPGDFSPAPGREEAAEEAVVLFFLSTMLDMHAYARARTRETENGGQWRQKTMGIVRMGSVFVRYVRFARISANPLTIVDPVRAKSRVLATVLARDISSRNCCI